MEDLLSSWPSLIILGIATVLEFIGNCVPVLDVIIDSAMAFVVPIMSVLGSLSTFGLFTQLTGSDQENRQLGAASGAIIFFQVVLVLFGVALAMSLRFFKMLLRLLGEGCLTGLLTALEVTWTCCVITMVIFIKPIAIVVAVMLCLAAAHAIKKKWFDKDEDDDVVIVEAVVEEGYVEMGNDGKKGEKRPISPVSKDEDDMVVIEQGKGYASINDKASV